MRGGRYDQREKNRGHQLTPAGFCAFIAGLALAGPVNAGAGAQVIDDAGVETPGSCHLESWVTHYDAERGLLNLSPACTRKAWPSFEIGGTVQHIRDGVDDTTIGPVLKFNIRSPERGISVAVSAAGNWSVNSGRLETASLIVPVTIPVTDEVQVNLNGGWTFGRTYEHRTAAFYGVQVMAQVTHDVSLMAESFRRDHGRSGSQVGLRWTPHGGNVDFDLLVGRRIDSVSPEAVTLGLTVRH